MAGLSDIPQASQVPDGYVPYDSSGQPVASADKVPDGYVPYGPDGNPLPATPGYGKTVADAFRAIPGQTEAAAGGLVDYAGAALKSRVGNTPAVQDLQNFGARVEQAGRESASPYALSPDASFGKRVAYDVVSGAPALAAGLTLGAVTKNPVAVPAMFAGMGAGEAYAENRDKPGALGYATASGGLNALTALPISHLLGASPAHLVARLGLPPAEFATIAAAQQAADLGLRKGYFDENTSVGDALKKISEAGLAGGITGLAGVPFVGAHAATPDARTPPVDQAGTVQAPQQSTPTTGPASPSNAAAAVTPAARPTPSAPPATAGEGLSDYIERNTDPMAAARQHLGITDDMLNPQMPPPRVDFGARGPNALPAPGPESSTVDSTATEQGALSGPSARSALPRPAMPVDAGGVVYPNQGLANDAAAGRMANGGIVQLDPNRYLVRGTPEQIATQHPDLRGGRYNARAGGRIVPAPIMRDYLKSIGDHAGAVDVAANQAAASPNNDLPHPTEAQKDAGNYQKGHIRIQGLDISIENPAGSRRRPEWPPLQDHYGYIKGTIGADKDHVDVFIGPKPEAPTAYVVDQVHPETGAFDEHKVVLGASSPAEAEAIYRRNYAPDWNGLGAMTAVPVKNLRRLLARKRTRPFGQLPEAKPSTGEDHAVIEGQQQQDDQQEHQGTPPGQDIRQDGGETRESDSGQTGGGDRAEGSGQEPQAPEVEQPRAAAEAPPAPPTADDLSSMPESKLRSYARGWGLKDTASRDRADLEAELREKRGGKPASTEAPPAAQQTAFSRSDEPIESSEPVGNNDHSLEQFRSQLSKLYGREVKMQQVDAPTPEAKATADVAKRLFGRDVVFFRSNEKFTHGAYHGGRTLYVNADSKRPSAQIIGHELLHSLRRESPDIYRALVRDINDHLNGKAGEQFRDKLAAMYQKQGLRPLKFDQAHEEMLAEVMGDHFADPTFIRQLQKALEPNLFRRIAAHVMDFIDKLKAKLGMARLPAEKRFVSDLDGARKAVADALAELSQRQREAPEAEGVPAVALSNDEAGNFAHDVASELGLQDETFRYPVSKARTLKGAMADIDPSVKFVGDATRPDEAAESFGAEKRYLLRTAKAQDVYVYEGSGKVWLDVSRLHEGDGGSAIYAAVSDYAKNTGQKFVGDPAGLSEAAVIRRTYNMLSSALRHGSTDHLDAAPEQTRGMPEKGVPPLKWHGDSVEKTKALVDTFVGALHNLYPELANVSYDFSKRQFVDDRNQPVAEAHLVAAADSAGGTRAARAGRQALRAGIILRSLLRAEGGQRPWILEKALRQPGKLVDEDHQPLFARGDSEDEFIKPGDKAAVVAAKTREATKTILDGLPAAHVTKIIGRGLQRETLASIQRKQDEAFAAMKSTWKVMDKRLRTDRAGIFDAIDKWETNRADQIRDPMYREFFRQMHEANEGRKNELLRRGIMDGAIEAGYFSHIWDNPDAAREAIVRKALADAEKDGTLPPKQEGESQAQYVQRVLASKGFTRKRTIMTVKEGLELGLKLKSDNPADIALMHLHQMDKVLAFDDLKNDLARRGWTVMIGAAERPPPGFATIDDPIFTKWGLAVSKDAGAGPAIVGHIAVPEPIAKDINNYLSPSLNQNPVWRWLRSASNLIIATRLGWSLFHFGLTSYDTVASHLAGAVQAFRDGAPVRGIGLLAKTPASLVTSPFEGAKLAKLWSNPAEADPQTAAVLKALEAGGARLHMDATDMNGHLTKFVRAIRQADVNALGEGLFGKVGTVAGAFAEAPSYPIMRWLVPFQKMTAKAMLMKLELERVGRQLGTGDDYAATVEAMHPDALRQIAAKVVDQVDDRLGQYAYDNIFMNRRMRDIGHATIQSLGWNYGSARVIGGGLKDLGHLIKPEELVGPLDRAGSIDNVKMPRLTQRLAYLVAMNGLGMSLNAGIGYAVSGQAPDSVADFFSIRTGRKNADGSDERMILPTYMRDEWALFRHPMQKLAGDSKATIGQTVRETGSDIATTISHKLHPALSMAWQLAHNRDYFGNQIVNPDDPAGVQGKQLAGYFLKNNAPYAIQGAMQSAGVGKGLAQKALPFVGVTPAPSTMTRTDFHNFVNETFYSNPRNAGGRSPEAAARSQKINDAVQAYKQGDPSKYEALSASEKKDAMTRVRSPWIEKQFSELTLRQQLQGIDRAAPAEIERYHLAREVLHHATTKSGQEELRSMQPDELAAVRAKLASVARQSRMVHAAALLGGLQAAHF